MVDRQDIDALLISALYGELTPADETRLATHLDSHPADRTALSDLTRAREVVHESRILQVQLDPPQSISALLLQEAVRRAPRRASEQGWFQRFMRSFMAHPAIAAAAMLVIVIGFATVISTRKGDHFSESQAPAADRTTQVMSSEPAAPSVGAAATSEGANTNKDQAPSEAVAGADRDLAGDDGLKGSGGDSFRVGLDDSTTGKLAAQKPRKVDSSNKREDASGDSVGGKADPKPRVVTNSPSKDPGYIELRKQAPAPKELGQGKADTNTALEEAVDEQRAGASAQPPSVRGGAPGGGAAGGTAPARDRQLGSSANSKAPAQRPQAIGSVKPPAAPPQAGARITATPNDERAASEKTIARGAATDGTSDPQFEWASAQHKRVTKQVRDGNCQDAASLALEIARRAPSYYQQNIATDRELKKCLSYINNEREKEAERTQRAPPSKSALDSESPKVTKPAATH